MIQLTRLNKHPLAVNSDLIKFVEQAPDTVITLVTGEKIVVLEKAQEVLDLVVQHVEFLELRGAYQAHSLQADDSRERFAQRAFRSVEELEIFG